jgi:hypothetical protein
LLEGVDAEMEAEEMETVSVGVVCKKNNVDPGPRGSAAHFLLGMEMEREQPVQEIDLSVEDILLDIKDSNKCQCPPPIVKLNPVDDDQVDKVKLAKKKMPKRRKIYGRSQKRGGDRKLGDGGEGVAFLPPVTPTWFAVAFAPDTRHVTKAQLSKCLLESESKRRLAEKNAKTPRKKLLIVSDRCRETARLAQERRDIIFRTEEDCLQMVEEAKTKQTTQLNWPSKPPLIQKLRVSGSSHPCKGSRKRSLL